jgi:anhydro-N-acetylmuramic acid kinase
VTIGGQGAPLAPFYHYALARHIGATEPLAFLNLGGVGNLTWVDPTAPGPESPGALMAFDTGPANAPLNDLMVARLGLPYDEGGAVAAKGEADEDFVAMVLKDPWFDHPPPKSLDRNDFHGLIDRLDMLSDEDAAATLTTIAAASVAAAQIHFPAPVTRILVTGGGRHNPTLMAELRRRIPVRIAPVEDVGLDGDMLEAQAFAFLAVRVLRKMATSGPDTTGAPALVGGGQISRPDPIGHK